MNTVSNKAKGFTLIEMLIGFAIFMVIMSFVIPFIARQVFFFDLDQASFEIAKVVDGVDRRNFNDGFLFSLWDENGGATPTEETLTWDEGSEFITLLDEYLTSSSNPWCGVDDGWNPANEGGLPDLGDETSVEDVALVGCHLFRNSLPFNIKLSAALSSDPVYDSVDKFRLYINLEDARFDLNDDGEVTMTKMEMFRASLRDSFRRIQYGTANVLYGTPGSSLDDIDDDESFSTPSECEAALDGGGECMIIAEIDYAGNTNGKFKTTDNTNSHVDDVTFTQGYGAGKQKCAYWSKESGTWTADIVDCAIKAGINDDEVTLVFDGAQSSNFLLTRKVADSSDDGFVEVSNLCTLFEPEYTGATSTSHADDKMILTPIDEESPCGLTDTGDVVQLISDEIHGGIAYVEEVVSDDIFAQRATLYSNTDGDVVLKVWDSTHTALAFTLDNNGNLYTSGSVDIGGDTTVDGDTVLNGDLTVDDNVSFALSNTSSVFNIGRINGNAGMSITRDTDTFRMHSDSTVTEFVAGDSLDEGVILEDQGDGNIEMRLKADHGVVAENGTDIHASFSTLLNQDFSSSGIDTDDLKSVSKLVTADMAKYLDDTSSPIQIVGIERVEGEYLQLTKPDCLAFMDDDNYSSADANPYRSIIDEGDLGDGESYARIVLVPMYIKTYNSAFGDNQVFSQHAAHSSATTWDIYLYLSGEGAFGTGAREDGAGGSLAMIMCDYSSINFSRQTF
ncbi:prepilin-type N-terminal cleavage/methylation domain-containing protein [Alteromonas sp. 14N.309.X.WAT.G.H12]|uniref:pilus assembly FimT family protein n=1 Tax=Alteromonas sp. 14N.309.X.WAT.G.H12 TaxID=3120824 RepID=UPI002FD45863